MRIYDISQELLSSAVYPGDPTPTSRLLSSMQEGELYNLTALSLCAHNGTHIDAPLHFIKEGNDVASIPLDRCVGYAMVFECEGDISAEIATGLVQLSKCEKNENGVRILIKGNATVTADAARVFALEGVYLIGTESQSVGPEDSPMEVHKILLSSDVVLLEGLRLCSVPEGAYLLAAQPISISGSDGAPCRAILISLD